MNDPAASSSADHPLPAPKRAQDFLRARFGGIARLDDDGRVVLDDDIQVIDLPCRAPVVDQPVDVPAALHRRLKRVRDAVEGSAARGDAALASIEAITPEVPEMSAGDVIIAATYMRTGVTMIEGLRAVYELGIRDERRRVETEAAARTCPSCGDQRPGHRPGCDVPREIPSLIRVAYNGGGPSDPSATLCCTRCGSDDVYCNWGGWKCKACDGAPQDTTGAAQ